MSLAKIALIAAVLSLSLPSYARPHRRRAHAARKHETKRPTKQAKADTKKSGDMLAGLPGF